MCCVHTCHRIFFYSEKYEFVGKLLKPGEEPTNYSDEEDESSAATTAGGAGDRPKED